MSSSDQMMEYFSGEKLYGDDFGPDEIRRWYELEAEGYADKLREAGETRDSANYIYYHLQHSCGFAHLPADLIFEHSLGFGSAFGYEYKPIAERVKKLTVLEPSELFFSSEVYGIPAEYIKPTIEGDMPFEDETFDLETSFGVLHHIPNVSKVMGELARCLKRGGHLLIREPICSQGDWTARRRGLTRNERGIPLKIFREIIINNGLEVVNEQPFSFRPIIKICNKVGLGHPFKWKWGVELDLLAARAFMWNYRYHPLGLAQRFTPTAVFYVLRKK